MKPAKAFAAISFFLLLTATGLRAACTSATAAGTFGFTTTGTLILPTGPAPVAAVGVVSFDRDGNTTGSKIEAWAASLPTKRSSELSPSTVIARSA